MKLILTLKSVYKGLNEVGNAALLLFLGRLAGPSLERFKSRLFKATESLQVLPVGFSLAAVSNGK